MKQLSVENFSCISKAKIDFSRLTIFIGPQASGKSVLCKLRYFFIEASFLQGESIVKRHSYEKFCEHLKKRFVEWFPASAWGKGKFKIQFESGDFSISMVRKTYAQTNSDDFRLAISPEFKNQYDQLLRETQKLADQKRISASPDDYRVEWQTHELSRNSLKKLMGKDFTSSQMFIPAGRSFFTSIGKAIAAFEQGRVLDPLILRFGRQYTAYKGQHFFYRESKAESLFRNQLLARLTEIFGGKLHTDGDLEFLETSDGRNIPLAALSSGQQELLPLVAVLPHLGQQNAGLCYIEEPEAHLFPSAQSKLVEALVTLLSSSTSDLSLVLTTHSPYVLAKVNNLIKADSLGRKKSPSMRKAVESVVSTSCWLNGRDVKAYAIKDGVVELISEKNNFINADYLDSVSGDIGREFSDLLDIEVSHA